MSDQLVLERPKTETLDAASDVEVLAVCPDSKGQRRFAMLANTGAPVRRSYGMFVVDLSGVHVRDKIPMLVDHNGSKIAGYADQMSFTDRGLELQGCLSKVTEFGKTVAGLSDEGFPWQASVGLDVLSREEVDSGVTVEVNGMQLEGPLSIARESTLLETSFLYSGADSSTYAVALSSNETPDIKEAPVAEAKTSDKEALLAFRAQFPGQEELATQAFLADKTVETLKLELAEKDREALAAATVQIETLTAERDAAVEELAALRTLNEAAGDPGIGFNGQTRQSGEKLSPSDSAPKTLSEAYESSEKLKAEFPTLRALEALAKREPETVAKILKEAL